MVIIVSGISTWWVYDFVFTRNYAVITVSGISTYWGFMISSLRGIVRSSL